MIHKSLLLPTSVKTCRELLRGILQYVHFHGPWNVHLIEGREGEQKMLHPETWGCTGVIGSLNGLAPARRLLASRVPTICTNRTDDDGDGMIDGWEHEMFVREYNEDEKIVPAPLDGGTIAAANRYGQYGNPDGDHLWSTADGWELTLPLYNWLEYCGPDGVEPWTIEEIPSASLGLPAGKTVRRAVVNPLDSSPRDTSHPLEADSDSDLYDDGFEYSWDRWQQVNDAALLAIPAGSPVLVCTRTTRDRSDRAVLHARYVFPGHRTDFVVYLSRPESSIGPSGLHLLG